MLYTVITRHWTCYTWYIIYDTDTRYLHRHMVITRHLACYTWYMIYDSGTRYLHWHGIYTGTWYLKPVPRHLIFRPGTWYMSYLTPDLNTRYMTCFHVVQTHWLDIATLERTLPPLIPILYDIFMTITLRGVDMVIILLLSDIWYSWTPVLLYTWTPEIGRLLTLLLILYSCWPP